MAVPTANIPESTRWCCIIHTKMAIKWETCWRRAMKRSWCESQPGYKVLKEDFFNGGIRIKKWLWEPFFAISCFLSPGEKSISARSDTPVVVGARTRRYFLRSTNSSWRHLFVFFWWPSTHWYYGIHILVSMGFAVRTLPALTNSP